MVDNRTILSFFFTVCSTGSGSFDSTTLAAVAAICASLYTTVKANTGRNLPLLHCQCCCCSSVSVSLSLSGSGSLALSLSLSLCVCLTRLPSSRLGSAGLARWLPTFSLSLSAAEASSTVRASAGRACARASFAEGVRRVLVRPCVCAQSPALRHWRRRGRRRIGMGRPSPIAD